jgi:hypothetical protein
MDGHRPKEARIGLGAVAEAFALLAGMTRPYPLEERTVGLLICQFF